ncbi:MAG: hypothetical protein A2666_04290 [Parcubacteria group bacterium RIFCSPHIGHO2_01_FULL_47_10b]|nr:MAG: hypothetical protein A2666_04290 [Parcubacteria group bacterium RIFCSPHIGHO2_01_FULL_47_10b]
MADQPLGAPPTNLPTGEGTAAPKNPRKFDETASTNLNNATKPKINMNAGAPYSGTGSSDITRDSSPRQSGPVRKDYTAPKASGEPGMTPSMNGNGIPGTNEEDILKELSKGGSSKKKLLMLVVGVLILVLLILLLVMLLTRNNGSDVDNNIDVIDDTNNNIVVPAPPVAGPTREERDLERVSEVQRIRAAVRAFYGSNRREPTSLAELVPLYLDEFPIGPNSENYFYSYSTDGQHYHIGALLEDSFHGGLLTDTDFDSRLDLNYVSGFSGEDPMFDLQQ